MDNTTAIEPYTWFNHEHRQEPKYSAFREDTKINTDDFITKEVVTLHKTTSTPNQGLNRQQRSQILNSNGGEIIDTPDISSKQLEAQ